MAKLKAFTSNIGFFQVAVAAPSRQAAGDALGLAPYAFAKGFASETRDKAICEAVLRQPGVVLRRPVGGKGKFVPHAALPKLDAPGGPGKKDQTVKGGKRAAQDAQAARRRQAAADARRENKRAAAQRALRQAQGRHAQATMRLDSARARLDAQADAENRRWAQEEKTLRGKIESIG